MAATAIGPSPNAGGERSASKAKAEAAEPIQRVFWRAVVRTTGGQVSESRERDRVEWHLAACAAPQAAGSHCTEGRHLMETIGHPDGHCIVDGACGLCGAPVPADEAGPA